MYAKSIQNTDTVDYTAGTAAVAAGDIVIQGGTAGKFVGIAHLDIPANTLGAISTRGIYDVVKGTAAAFEPGSPVYWDDTNHVATNTASTNTRLGCAVAAAASTAANVRMILDCRAGNNTGGSISPASAIASLTDNSGGTAGSAISEVEDTNTCDALASLTAKVNAILAALRQTGVIAS